VLLEPLLKFLSPVFYLLHPAASFWTRVYLLLIILWTILVWSVFGGAISRMAVVQVARPTERVGMVEAVRFAISRYRSYVASQLLPFAFLAGLVLLLLVFGLFQVIPLLDVVVAAIGFPLALLLGLIMAVVLIGLTGWPLMYATIGAEGSDSFDAISRSYSYVYQGPWHYLWYALVTLAYGAALVFFVGLVGSLLVYLGKFGTSVAAGAWSALDPTYLYQFAPTSYGWRDLLLHNSPGVTTELQILNTGQVVPTYSYTKSLFGPSYLAAALSAFWLYLLFLMIIGFGYSFFWTASSIIYLLMRYKVDDTELDEVHLEEEEIETPTYATPGAPAAAGEPGRTTVPLNVVEGPPPTAPAATGGSAASITASAPRTSDGEPPGTTPSGQPAGAGGALDSEASARSESSPGPSNPGS
jgi:hypothetical protein